MYRSKYRTPQTPSDTRFWDYASRLRRSGFRHSIHALAYINPRAYRFVVDSMLSGISLELIMCGLYQDYSDSLNQMQVNGWGSLSPNSLLTFRRNLEQGNHLDVSVELNQKNKELHQLIDIANRVDKLHLKVADIEDRVGISTKLGLELIRKEVGLNSKIIQLQQQLALVK